MLMDIEVGTIINGFKAVRARNNNEIGGTLYEFVHETTGTELVWLDNGAINKLFCVAFKTLPEDDTGVFHIIEHSVLCGSEKFPVKEPFVELIKSSMNTFLNALTYQDKTVYPVSSRNNRDFLNLTEVYLDAVFRPAILKNPNIFYQEGHHIEQAEDGTLSYKGVVFNEMKGALSKADRLVDEEMSKLLFEGSPYGVNSGGDPAAIPDLTYAKFIDTYKKHYHPSNARIYLEGDIPFEETFKLIGSYFDQVEKGIKIPDPIDSEPVSRRNVIKYALAENESLENRGIYALAKIFGSWRDKVKLMAADVLSDVLLGTNDAPLKREVLSSGLAKDIYMYVDTQVLQPYMYIECTNIADGKDKELKELIIKTAKKIAEEGIDREQLEASISRMEFHSREKEEPVALRRAISALISWLHDGDPMLYLADDDDFAALRDFIDRNCFEELLNDLFSEEGICEVLALPDHNIANELRRIESEKLDKIRQSWTEEDKAANIALNKALTDWQHTPDSEEALATMPVLPLPEISSEPFVPPTIETQTDGVTLLYHDIPCHGLVHFNVYIDLSDMTLREITVLSRIGLFFGVLPTSKYDSLTLQKVLKKTVGRLNFGLSIKGPVGNTEKSAAYFTVSCSALRRDVKEAAELMKEILYNTDFSLKDKIKEIVIQNDEWLKQSCISSGHQLGLTVSMAGTSSEGALNEAINGLSYINYSHSLANDFDGGFEEFVSVIEKLKSHFHKGRITVSLVGEDPEDAKSVIEAFLPANVKDTGLKGGASFSCDIPAKTGCIIPARIGFAAQGYNFGKDGIRYDGSMSVAAKIASLDYLWNVIRVQGGAYGAGLFVSPGNDVRTYSYRDPSPVKTLGENRKIGDFLRKFAENGQSLDRYIISSIADCEPLTSPRVTGIIGDNNWFSGMGEAEAKRIREEMLATDAESIKRFADILDRFAEEGPSCVVAIKETLDQCEGITVYNV